MVSARRINGIARPSKTNDDRPASEIDRIVAEPQRAMNRLERNPDQQIAGAEQNRPDRGQRDRHFDLDTGADVPASVRTLTRPLKRLGDLAHHFETDTAAGDFAERGAGGHARAEDQVECGCGRETAALAADRTLRATAARRTASTSIPAPSSEQVNRIRSACRRS